MRLLALVLAALPLLASCAMLPSVLASEPEPTCETIPLEVVVKGSDTQNPSPEGQSMAVEVRVMALAKRDAFDRLDYDTAVQKGEETLGGDVLASTRVTVFPSDEQIVPMSAPPKTRYVALVGSFRRAEGDGWGRIVDVQALVARCKPGGLAGLVRAQLVDNRIQAPATAE